MFFPLSARQGAFHRLLSAVADALGARDGVVLADDTGREFAATQNVVVLMPRDRQQAVDTFTRRAQALGYRPSEAATPLGAPPGRALGFEPSPVLPQIQAYVCDAGEPMLLHTLDPAKPALRFVVPDGACGIYLQMRVGATQQSPLVGDASSPTVAAREHLSNLGIDITPPTPEYLRRRWRRERLTIRAGLEDAARRIGAKRGRVVRSSHLGPAGVGPYTFVVGTIQRADPDELAERVAADAGRLANPAAAPAINILTYRPGQPMIVVSSALQRDEPRALVSIPDGHAGLLVGLTRQTSDPIKA